MDAILKQFQALGVKGADPAALEAFLYHTTFEKGVFIIKPGQVEQYLYFLESGVLRFYIEQAGKEITFDFALPGNFTSAYSSFLTRTPARFFIQALEKVSIYRISYHDLQKLYQDLPVSQQIGRLAAEQLFVRKTERELSLLTESAEQRYLNLLEQNSELVQQIPLKYLASYIGITPQALSRIRKRIS